MNLTSCPDPQCAAPAEEVDRYLLNSTDGPITHILTHCARGHHFTHIEEPPCVD